MSRVGVRGPPPILLSVVFYITHHGATPDKRERSDSPDRRPVTSRFPTHSELEASYLLVSRKSWPLLGTTKHQLSDGMKVEKRRFDSLSRPAYQMESPRKRPNNWPRRGPIRHAAICVYYSVVWLWRFKADAPTAVGVVVGDLIWKLGARRELPD